MADIPQGPYFWDHGQLMTGDSGGWNSVLMWAGKPRGAPRFTIRGDAGVLRLVAASWDLLSAAHAIFNSAVVNERGEWEPRQQDLAALAMVIAKLEGGGNG